MSYFGKDDPRLEDIRRRAQDRARNDDWAGLRAMESELRTDVAFWTGIWAPISSYAAWKCGEANPRVLLDEAIAHSYEGSGDFDHLLTEAFGADTDWPELVAAIRECPGAFDRDPRLARVTPVATAPAVPACRGP
jgi:hypothetical protein